MISESESNIRNYKNDSGTLKFIYLKHQYLIIHTHLFLKTFLEVQKLVSKDIYNLAFEKAYKITKDLLNVLCLMEDFKMQNEELYYDEPSELERFLEDELSNPDYYIIETIKEENSKVSKDDILDFKRFTFKNFQEVLERIEAANEDKASVLELKNQTEKLQLKMAEGAVEIFNQLSDLAKSFEWETDDELKAVVQLSLDKALRILEKLNIEEIPTYGMELDGNYMVSLGTIDNLPGVNLPQDHVAVVYNKAFKLKGSNKVIQNALVKTIK
ncbi:nucleotide exchange factor GrpE [Metaplanococcus flavidus]